MTTWFFRLLVLWNIVLVFASSEGRSQTGRSAADSTRSDSVARMLFGDPDGTRPRESFEKSLRAILSAGAGPYATIVDELYEQGPVQPIVGFDLYAQPGGWLGFIAGVRLALAPSVTSSVTFGLRQPLFSSSSGSAKFFGDFSALFFNGGRETGSFEPGARLAFTAASESDGFAVEGRLAGEYRGRQTALGDKSSRPLWWFGAEVGIGFSLIGAPETRTRADSIKAALRAIATDDELDDFERLEQQSPTDEQLELWLTRFWRARDVSPRNPVNEARDEFERRVVEANERYSRSRKLGVSTDPGRLLLVYGLPSEEQTILEGSIGTDYLIWTYHNRIGLLTSAVFLFNRTSGNIWRLIYSNVPQEGLLRLPGIPYKVYQQLPASVQ